jgi:HSP90 family molecular chaperone
MYGVGVNIHLREPKEVTDEEYREFYKATAKDASADTLGWAHFKVCRRSHFGLH